MKEIDELYGKMLAVFEEKTGFTMDDTADLASPAVRGGSADTDALRLQRLGDQPELSPDGDGRVSGLPRGAARDHEKGGDEGKRLAAVPAGCCAGRRSDGQ